MVQRSTVGNSDNISRYWLLDIIRILAALWVAIYHLTGGHGWFASLKHPYGNILLEGKLGIFSTLVRLGFLGVPIFFVISAFVIVHSGKNKSPLEFFVARFTRLAPGFIFSILLTLMFCSYGYRGENSLNLTKIISSFGLLWESKGLSPIQGSYWTLWPEVRFYGLFLIFVLMFNRKSTFGRKATLFFMGWLISLWFSGANTGLMSLLLVSDFAVYFILGGLLALSQDLKKFWGLSPFLLGATLIVFLNLREFIYRSDVSHPTDWQLGIVIFTISVLLIGFSGNIKLKNRISRRIISSLGRSSYIVYLLQEGIGMPITSFLVSHGSQIRYAIPFSLLIVITISILFTELFEQKIINWSKEHLLEGLRSVLKQDLKSD